MEVLEEAEICLHCGCRVAPKRQTNDTNKTLGTIAKILMFIAIGIFAFAALIFAILGILVSTFVIPIPPDPEHGATLTVLISVLFFVSAAVYALALNYWTKLLFVPIVARNKQSLQQQNSPHKHF